MKKRLSFKQRRILAGYLFSLPFLLGFTLFFFYPFIQAFIFSFNELVISREGFVLNFKGFDNYGYILNVHPDFLRIFVETILDTITNVPLVLAFSFFAALVLNQRFKGRFLARTIFFLPVILSAGIIIQMDIDDMVTQLLHGARNAELIFTGVGLRNLLMNTKLPEGFIEFILGAVDRIPDIIRASGIQILIFLAGLQSIPPSIYEAADVEGATGWESFWLITFPMMSPIILTNAVYTIIDTFLTTTNEVVMLVRDEAIMGAGYGVSMAMAVLYFVMILIILGITIKVSSRWVFYQE
ncbi:MAG TPA: sugar ABC transporter permease [Halanaerobiaceae bacterium]|jgi:ABC-type sugar transport system permease subunit|nr:sugar ABC transporter permease [Halanaerobiaceae bacterium]